MTKTHPYEIEVDLTTEELKAVAAKARSVGLDVETYARVRMVSADELPEPAAFFALFRRLSAFAKDYETCMQSFADMSPDADKQSNTLAKTFAQLLQDWDDRYGPR